MNCNRGVTKDSLRPCGGHNQALIAAIYWISYVPKVALKLFFFNFQVGQNGQNLRRPVHHPLGPVNEPLLIKAHKNSPDRLAQAFIQSETLALPVNGNAQRRHLFSNSGMRLVLPAPNFGQKLLTPQVKARYSFLGKLPFHDHLRGNPSVVGPRKPQRVFALHARKTHHRVLDCKSQSMPHMEHPSNVRGRNYNAKWLLV
ncbi:MAG: hypothetical protein BWX66_01598 [Deltaproteobacteria bacterium ADurb.Bin058]|nr:MAG: hypothetical protein BWX66_01598 [Deltaproteobacteria bacterium ADurb.Bin058]